VELAGARIVLGVSGGIAAYKAADLCSQLVHAGAQVRVAMSRNAPEFVAPLTFEALSGYPAYTRVLKRTASYEMEHISWAKWANLLLIAPASADIIARMAGGIADDPITTTYLASPGPVVLAPAMNSQMLSHPATQNNLVRLAEYGVKVLPCGEGPLACGDTGSGRLLEPEQIMEFLRTFEAGSQTLLASAAPYRDTAVASDSTLAGKTVLITSGPTREFIDPVRFISSPSSGKMGAALAREACRRGAKVHLVTGPVEAAQRPDCAQVHEVTTAEQMLKTVEQLQAEVDVFIFAAAVGDFRVGSYIAQKIKRTGNSISLPLVENPDIAQSIGYRKRPEQVTVGFAAETDDLEANATGKMERKKLDVIVANDVSAEGTGFASDENAVTLYFQSGKQVQISRRSKDAVAREIFEALLTEKVI
jgi:phosphopantothenoylcysteine decarboxylase/phosphopantothenate--cysteine ligase